MCEPLFDPVIAIYIGGAIIVLILILGEPNG